MTVVDRLRSLRGLLRRWRLRLLIGLAVLLVVSGAPTVWERVVAAPYVRPFDAVPPLPVALVFGALVDGNRPSAFLAGRLDAAVALYRRGTVTTILVSGNDDHHGYDEPDVMRDYLLTHGVPAAHIVADHAGYDTWDTCVRARSVFGVREAILVTQTFHVWRAVAICRANGVNGFAVGIDSMRVGVTSTLYGYVREYFAADKALWSVLTG